MLTKDLEAFFEGWNRHDVDCIMTFMADDCVFETTAGKEAWGTRYAGRENVRDAFARVFKMFPDATFVVTHRDPVAVTVSLCTMLAYTARGFVDTSSTINEPESPEFRNLLPRFLMKIWPVYVFVKLLPAHSSV